MDFDFDLQEFLGDMRREAREDVRALSTKIDTKFNAIDIRFVDVDETMHDHDLRLFQIEVPAKRRRWITAALITATLPIAVDLIFNHVPKILSAMSATTAVIK